ncbi:ATP-binding protein [Ochrobactrum quorumnocens]|uniref:ATP-binding protein n=1 Tax=Ochrobactrum quorumnocens TaxID=271865 RepID=UPI003854207C
MDRLRKTDRRTMRFYWLASVIVVLIASIGAGTMIQRDYNRRMNVAAQQAMSLAQALAEHTTQVFTKLEVLSWALIEDQSDRIVDDSLLSEVMRRRAAAEPAVLGIAIVSKRGRIVASGLEKYAINSDVGGQADYLVLSRNDAPPVYISKPYRWNTGLPAAPSKWVMSYARRINDQSGNFDGYVLIIINEAYLYGFYSRLGELPDLVLGLVGTDGIVRASNDESAIGREIPRFIEDYVEKGNGIQTNVADQAGIRRVFANYQSAVTPLVAYVGLPSTPLYRAWIASSSIIVSALIALFTALVALGFVLSKYVKNRGSLMSAVLDALDQRREREFLETIVNTGAVLMIVTDSIGQVIVTNHAIRALFPELNDAQSKTDFFPDVLGKPLVTVLDNLPWQGVNNIVLNDGRKRALSWSVSPILTHDGTIKNLIAVGLDITERREAELAIYQSGKLITLGEVATGIAHEINQPLATLSMAIFNLQTRDTQGTLDETTIREGLALAASQIDRAAKIVRHMRVYGHRSDGKLQPLDPVDAIEGVLTIIGAQIEKQGIAVRRRYNQNEYLVAAELVLLEQILLNLILNARDAVLDKTGDQKTTDEFIEISVSEWSEETICINVKDSGPGISAAIIDRVFEPFFTTKQVGQGTGLGLSLSYGMAREMGGQLRVRNSEAGAEFRLILNRAS